MESNIPDINQELIRSCIRGDRVAQYRLYKQYSRTMYNLCLRADEIHQAILRLPEGARAVCVLHLLEGYRHSDIAGMLGISESTSKSQYRRAVSLLQESLMKKMYEK